MALDYTPEQKNRLEIEKLYAEVIDLRSWVRRWLGTLGGLLGIITAAVSVIVTTNQWSRSTREADLKMQQAEERLAEAKLYEIQKSTGEKSKDLAQKTGELANKSKELERMTGEVAEKQKQLDEVTKRLVTAEQNAGALPTPGAPGAFSAKGLDLLITAAGIDQPSKWPGGPSGITLGIGYDLGFVTKEDFQKTWKNYLTADQMARLETVIGISGSAAGQRASGFADIVISREAAVDAFTRVSLPQYQARTAVAFPGYDKLPVDVQGALVSLVFERGIAMDGDRRKEMRAIRAAVASGNLQEIANQFRAMKRLWQGTGLDGLVRHLEAEALLVESAIPR
jgi:gas vesicle protein/GH24 family phage-related lysozyme (muramidase)